MGDEAPLAKYLIVVSPQAVDAFHHHKVIWLQRPKKGLIARSVEVFAALVVDEDVLAFNGEQRQRIKLAVEVLISSSLMFACCVADRPACSPKYFTTRIRMALLPC